MKSFIKRFVKGENGQAFPMALVILAMGSLFVTGFLTAASTSVMNSEIYRQPVQDNYTADAGIEDAIWNLQYGTLADELVNPEDQKTYTLPVTVNGATAEITVILHQSVVASHDFEDNKWSGGTGWLYSWYRNGSVSMTTGQNPQQGTRHVQMRGSNAYLDRAADLSGYTDLRLQFWAKVRSFERSDFLECLISPDDIHWTTVQTWNRFDSDNQYHFFDIDLSSYETSSEFWIAFDSEMSGNNDYFYIDDLKILGPKSWEIISIAGERTTRVSVEFVNDVPVIYSWEIE